MDDPPAQQSLIDEEARDIAGRLGRGAIGLAGSIVAALIVLLFITYVAMWFQKPSPRIVGSIESWVYFIGNVVVACYCFPAFRASRRRAFLYLSHHGAATCTEADPHCGVCPLLDDCPEGKRRTADSRS